MQFKPFIAKLLVGAMVAGQFGWVSVAWAEDAPSPSPSPEVTVTPQPTASPAPSTTPEPSATPVPSATPEPSGTPVPTATPKPEKEDISYSKPGVNGCVGVIPRWVYDVANEQWVPADKGSFTCEPSSGYYLSPKYVYDKQSGWYKILPAGAPLTENMVAAPNVVHTVLGDLVVGSKDYQVAEALGLLDPTSGIVAANSGSGSSPVATATPNQSWFDLTNLVNVINTLQSTAVSGDVEANKNTQVGSAVTGAAGVLANLINLLSSAWSWSNGNLNFFMQNIFDNMVGDIRLNPVESTTGGGGSLGGNSATIGETGAGSNNAIGLGNSSSLDVNAQNQGNIVNNVDLLAQSGNVNANQNTSVGNLATGQAIAEINIINLINSMITSGSSFFGILNIFGNLNGDILFPEGFLNGLVPSGTGAGATNASIGQTGAGSTNGIGVDGSTQTTMNNAVYNGVNNNIATNAASGNANLDSNTTVGNVASGNATTSNSLFNIANSSIFGDNAVLVIVNVLGHWVGKIMTIPGGGNSAALLTGNATTAGIGQTGADSTNTIDVAGGGTANINQASAGTITNNVNVNAQSGDVNAAKNTEVGNVQTGDAKAASNVANIFNTALNVKHWFGVLVINVFGDWFGSVNDDTEAGEAPASATLGASAAVAGAATPSSFPKVGLLSLVGAGGAAANHASTTTEAKVSDDKAQVLTAAAHQTTPKAAAAAQSRDMSLLFALSAVIMLIAGALATIDSRLRKNAR